jgi:hypothetical protein
LAACNFLRNSQTTLVFNGRMKRLTLALAAALFTVGVVPGLASAQEIQVGNTTTALAAPTCPQEATVAKTQAACTIVLAKTTAYQTLSDTAADPTLITTPGVIDSFTLGISGLVIQGATLSADVATLNGLWGGAPSAQLTVLRPVANVNGPRWAVAAQSPVIPLLSYLGGVVEFPLIAPLPVVKGELLAITVPTWAPILTIGLSTSDFSYAQSHTKVLTGTGTAQTSSCNTTATATPLAQVTLGEQALYTCEFPGTRVEYTALEVTAPSVSTSSRLHHHRTRRASTRHATKR